MREIKFRGMDANGTMRYGRLSQDKPDSTAYYKEYSQRICWDDSNMPVKNSTLGQYTGLKDNTEWEQLTGKEKQEFYDQHKSEDGRTIKYQNIDDVKHLWNGREIYEGDILSFHVGKDLKEVFMGDVYWFDNEAEFEIRHPEGYHGRYSFKRDFIEVYSMQVIGNIYENPELLEA